MPAQLGYSQHIDNSTAAMFGVMALIAIAVYEFVGLTILRRAWVNLDGLWAGALVVAGALVLVA